MIQELDTTLSNWGEAKTSIFTVKKEDYTPEQWDRMQRLKQSEDRAYEQLKAIYGVRVANIVIFNIPIIHYNIYRKFADTYEQACEVLGDEMISEIIYRAVSGLPAIGTDRKSNQSLADYWGQYRKKEK